MPLVFDSDRSFLNSTTAAVSFLLADAVPPLAGSEEKFNPQVNQNLFLAANNTRLPADSFTIYHIGFGKAKSISSEVKNVRQIPLGEFSSLWLGLSPVVERRSSNTPYYEPHGNIKIIADAGGEDGANSDVQLISIANGDEFSSRVLQNVHTQIYTEFFSQNADVSQINFLEEKTDYIREVILSSRASSVTLGTKLRWKGIFFGTNYNFDELLPNSLRSRLLLNLGIDLSDRLSLAGYYTPINKNTARSRYGATASWRFGNLNNSTLTLGWANTEYQFEDGFTQSDDVFTLSFRLGEPANPFSPATTEQLKEEPDSFQQQ